MRFKVSNKETVDSVIEMFPGVAITVKGTYTPPGRKAGAGERKLYIELMGYSELNVRLCKREIIRIMKETAAAQVSKKKIWLVLLVFSNKSCFFRLFWECVPKNMPSTKFCKAIINNKIRKKI